jgi:hypothetical protein
MAVDESALGNPFAAGPSDYSLSGPGVGMVTGVGAVPPNASSPNDRPYAAATLMNMGAVPGWIRFPITQAGEYMLVWTSPNGNSLVLGSFVVS